jgi:thiol-disulfide isomerase/thioredoxin
MKKLLLTTSVSILLIFNAFSQSASIPKVDIKDLEGSTVNTGEFQNDGNPMIISFWATWCKPCIRELNAISEIYDDMVDETGVKLITISIDDARTMSKVAPFVNSQGWDYEAYLDPNGDFRRVMNVNLVPHTFLFDGNGDIVRQHTSYAPGDEEKLFDLVRQTAEGKAAEE